MVGVYKIINKINGKIYVGQSWHLKNRIKSHFENKKMKNTHLYQSIKKYGEDNFIVEMIEIEDPTQEKLDELEIRLIEEYKSTDRKFGYNIREGGSKGRHSNDTKNKMREKQLGKKHSTESIRKMSKSMMGENHPNFGKHLSDETKKKISKSNLGKIVSEETKLLISLKTREAMKNEDVLRKISESSKNREYDEEYRNNLSERTKGDRNPFYGKKHSEESLEKMVDKKILHKKVLCVDLGIVYDNSYDAAKKINGHSSNILKVCHGLRKKANGFMWKFIEEDLN